MILWRRIGRIDRLKGLILIKGMQGKTFNFGTAIGRKIYAGM
jgi:hypothetical protein